MVDGTGAKRPLIEVVYEHPLLRSLAHGNARFRRGQPDWLGRGLPSYIPSSTFVLVLLDVLRSGGAPAGIVGSATLLTDARRSLEKVEDDDLRRILTVLVGDADQLADGVAARSNLVSERLESWFNDCMVRTAGWYKRRAQAWSLGLALLISIAFNADTFHVVRRLWDDAALRRTVAAAAEVYRDVPTASVPGQELSGRLLLQWQELEHSPLPIGWTAQAVRALPNLPYSQPLGWLLTAAAVSLGAAFWFDLLSRALRLRSTGGRISPATGRVEGAPAEVTS